MSKKVLQTLSSIYDEDNDGYELSRDDRKSVSQTGSSSTYGEITPKATSTLLDYLEIGRKDVLYDLGSGVGKFVMQTALSCPAKKVVGLELSKERHAIARQALKQAKKVTRLKTKEVAFRNADIMKAKLSDATIVYTCSTAFPTRFLNKLTRRLSHLKEDTLFVSLQELDDNPWFIPIDTLKLDMSWQKRTPVHVYLRMDK